MASLELIDYYPHRTIVSEHGSVRREQDHSAHRIKGLPQIFWDDGSSWKAANLWAFVRATNGITDIKTIRANLSHIHKYAQWLEDENLDWLHFPILIRERVLIRWRKHLLEQRDKLGLIAPSTASQRMNSTINFYKFAKVSGLIDPKTQMWKEHRVIVRYFDSVGFERTMLANRTDIAIRNRPRHGPKLENGLMPLTNQHREDLLTFSGQPSNVSREIDLMLKLGFFSGARIETITDLKRGTLANAVTDTKEPGLYYLSVGPGSRPHVATKFKVSGQISIPAQLFEELQSYAHSVTRLKREALATPENKDLLFLTRYGNRYGDRSNGSGTAIGRAMLDLRRKAAAAGLKFAEHFHFHMTRATFGTSLTALLLSQPEAKTKEVLDLVCSLMLHKDIQTTLKYINFVEQSPMKAAIANDYSKAFLGLRTRLGENHV